MCILNSDISQSCTNQKDKNQDKVTEFVSNNGGLRERNNSDSDTKLANQGVITQLSEQISSLHDRMDKFTNRIEELNSKLTTKKNCPSQQNMALQAEVCDGTVPTSYFSTSLGNGSLTKESPLRDEISGIALGQRQIMHQLDDLNDLLCGNSGEKPHQTRTNKKSVATYSDSSGHHIMVAAAIGCLGIFLMKGLLT